MTIKREDAKELLPIVKALAEGKMIQDKIEGLTDWVDTDEINLEFEGKKILHRIKPEPKYRPFKTKEECWDEMHKHSDFGWVKFCNSICFIQNISFNKITVISDEEICSTSFEGGFTNMKFADGTPFGIKE